MKLRVVKYLFYFYLTVIASLFVFSEDKGTKDIGIKIDLTALKAEEEFRWGVRAFHNGFFDKAILSFEKAIRLKPNNVLPRIWLGRAYYRSGYITDALTEWDYVLKTGGGSDVLRYKHGTVTLRHGLGKELREETKLVVSGVIDSKRKGYYSFSRPTSVFPVKNGNVYIVCFASNEVLYVDLNQKIEAILRGGIEGYDHPFDIVRVNDFLYITEYEGNRIAKCKLNGEKIKIFGKKGTGDGDFLGPQYIAFDDDRYLYVTDWGNARVNKYDLDGNFILSFSAKMKAPTGIGFYGGLIYVADISEKLINIYDESGNFLRSIGKSFLESPEGIFIDKKGRVIVADSNRIVRYNPVDETWKVIGNPKGANERILDVAVTPNNDVYATDFNNSRVVILSEVSSLYNSFFVNVERIHSLQFPRIIVDISVSDIYGNPIVGLKQENFNLTESYSPVGNLEIVNLNTDSLESKIVVLVEHSEYLAKRLGEIKEVVGKLYDQMSGKGEVEVITVEDKPVIRGKMGLTKLKLIESSVKGSFSEDWSFDLGLRRAVSELIPLEGKKAIVYIGSGEIDSSNFRRYSLTNLANYLKNNYIAFYPIYLARENRSEELKFLSLESKGREYSFFSVRGITGIGDEIVERITPVYTLTYVSNSNSDFGRKYIPVEVFVSAQKRGGRDVSGYYAPLK